MKMSEVEVGEWYYVDRHAPYAGSTDIRENCRLRVIAVNVEGLYAHRLVEAEDFVVTVGEETWTVPAKTLGARNLGGNTGKGVITLREHATGPRYELVPARWVHSQWDAHVDDIAHRRETQDEVERTRGRHTARVLADVKRAFGAEPGDENQVPPGTPRILAPQTLKDLGGYYDRSRLAILEAMVWAYEQGRAKGAYE